MPCVAAYNGRNPTCCFRRGADVKITWLSAVSAFPMLLGLRLERKAQCAFRLFLYMIDDFSAFHHHALRIHTCTYHALPAFLTTIFTSSPIIATCLLMPSLFCCITFYPSSYSIPPPYSLMHTTWKNVQPFCLPTNSFSVHHSSEWRVVTYIWSLSLELE